MPDEVMSQRVTCPGCEVRMTLRHFRYGHTCYVPRGRPRKKDAERESEMWDRAIAALARRLTARDLAVEEITPGPQAQAVDQGALPTLVTQAYGGV